MRQSTATQQFAWRSSRLSGDLYAAVHSYSSGAVPDCRGIYTMATQQFVWCSSRLSGDFYMAVHSYSANYMAQMAQFPTVGGFLCSSPQLFRNLHGAVPDCREIYIRRSTATQQFAWHSSRLSGDLYAAVHSYSAICMAQFPTVGRFTLCLLSYLHGTVPDCQEIYTMATQQFIWRSSRLSGDFYVAVHSYSAICYGAVPDCREIYTMATQQFVWCSSRLSGDLYVAVHSYSVIYMAQFPTVGRFLCGGPQLLSNLHGAVPDCQEIYTMATQQFA